MQKFTAIYIKTWQSGSHWHSSEHMRRIEQREGESVGDMLDREGIKETTVFLFVGHPKLEGEENTLPPAC